MEPERASGRRIELGWPALVVGAAAIAAGWASGQTGDRLFVLVQVGLLSILVLSGLWSIAVSRRVRASVTMSSADAIVGQPVQAAISVTGWRRPILMRMTFPAVGTWVNVEPPASGTLIALAADRGVFTGATVEVLARDPLGLVGFSYRREVPLPRALVTGPLPVPWSGASFPPGLDTLDGHLAAASDNDVVRGVRDHRTGDPLRLVHWPTTARTGRLAVKELEGWVRGPPTMVLVVDLGDGGPATEPAAGTGAWVALEALRRGYHLVLATAEETGPVTGVVGSPLAVSRRLARAAPGKPQPPPGAERATITVAVTSSSDQV